MRFTQLVLLALTLSQSIAFPLEYDYIRVPKSHATFEWMKKKGFIEDHIHDDFYLVGYLPKGSLHKEDWDKVLTLDAEDWAHHRYDVKTLQRQDRGTPPPPQQTYEEFHTYETLTEELQALAKKHSDLVTLESAGKTVQGRQMWLMKLAQKKRALPSRPKLLYISSMHGDEVTGKEMMVYLLRFALTQYGKDPRITRLLDNNEISIMPSMNPDGTELKTRFNADGVDLNRDFPLLNESPTDPNRAIEVRNIQALHQKNHYLTALNFHGGELCVNIPWDSKPNGQAFLFGDNALMMALARVYADLNPSIKANNFGNFVKGVTYGYEWYPVYGGMQDWASHFYQSTHATIEISSIKWPSASELPQHWRDNQESLLQFLDKSTIGVHLKVVDGKGNLLPVQVELGSAKRTLSFNGYVHRPSSTANETVTLKSSGFQTREILLTSQPFSGTYQEVVMLPN